MEFTKIDNLEYKFWNGVSKIEKLEGTKLHRKAEFKKCHYELKALCVVLEKAKELGVDIW